MTLHPLRRKYGLKENAGGMTEPFDRVTFYAGGARLIESYTRTDTKVVERLPDLFARISEGGAAGAGDSPAGASGPAQR